MSGPEAVVLSLIAWWLLGVSMALQPEMMCNHTAGQQIRNYVRLEKHLMTIVANTVELRRNTLSQLAKQHEVLTRLVGEVTDRSQYLASLLNSVSMVSRLAKAWPVAVALARITGEPLEPLGLPAMVAEAWQSAVKSLVRLQSIYNISTQVLVSGRIEGTYSHANLTASDCFDVGLHYFQQQKHERAVEWLLAAHQRASADPRVPTPQILEHLHLAQCFKGDKKGSFDTLKFLLKGSPSFKPSEKLLKHHATAASLACHQPPQNTTSDVLGEDDPRYQLCRPELYQHPSDKQLRCRLLHYNRSELRIGPLKMEELHIDPPLLMFHQVIYPEEIEHLTETFYTEMRPATQDYNKYNIIKDLQYNIWIESHADMVSKKISLRTSQYTNMKLEFAEPTMLANYGLGGEIVLHQDLGDYHKTFDARNARADYISFLFYLNDVEEGGLTIYPNINVTVRPVKGAALMWFNRFPDLTPSVEVQHSGCPVLRGTKWIINKWLHVHPQDFPECLPGKEKSYKYFYL